MSGPYGSWAPIGAEDRGPGHSEQGTWCTSWNGGQTEGTNHARGSWPWALTIPTLPRNPEQRVVKLFQIFLHCKKHRNRHSIVQVVDSYLPCFPNGIALDISRVRFLTFQNGKLKNKSKVFSNCVTFYNFHKHKGSSNKTYGFHNPYTVRIVKTVRFIGRSLMLVKVVECNTV